MNLLPVRRVPVRVHGIATLTVVMVLFFIMAMVAAYTNRNLIFEQRTSVNSYRSTQALIAAEAGVDWAIAQINGGTINATCEAGDDATDEFRWRYLYLKHDGTMAAHKWPGALGVSMAAQPACVLTPGGPLCSCPSGPLSTLPMVSTDAPMVFAVRFLNDSLTAQPNLTRIGAFRIRSAGCTSAHTGLSSANVNDKESCHRGKTFLDVDGSMGVEVTLGLVSALPVPPVAAVTAGGGITQAAGTLTATNEDAGTAVALHAGGAISGTTNLRGPAGSTANLSLPSDAELQGLAATAGDFFRATFGMPMESYRQQPAAARVNCAAGCTWAELGPVLAANPSRVIYLEGNVTLDQATTIGSTTLPSMLVATGNVTIAAPVTLNGVIYSDGNLTWQAGAAGGLVRGALMSNGSFSGQGNVAVAYDAEVIRRLHQAYGSYVRVPGSWRTF
ncbi:MAG: hypothetical protein HY855_17595 [Burkholderiales bacterium]|nr:hypothetical protein [Burkholderiales bacterium]